MNSLKIFELNLALKALYLKQLYHRLTLKTKISCSTRFKNILMESGYRKIHF